jgi:hypothetical protein
MKQSTLRIVSPCMAALFFLCAAVSVHASGAQEGARCLVTSGHRGAIRDLEYDERTGFLFSSGEDGTVRIWAAGPGSLNHTLRPTQLFTDRLAVNPMKPQLAVIVTDGTGAFFLSVWDWETEKELYRLPLKEAPLFLRFSGGGSYLMYGISAWQGLQILEADDGTPVSFHPEGFGIVGFAEISRSEKTLMTYQVSGSIAYWDLATGQQTRSLSSIPFLSGIRISRDKNSIVGFTDREITIVDTVTGTTRSRATFDGVMCIDVAESGREVAAVSAAEKAPVRWSQVGDTLTRLPSVQSLPVEPTLLRYGAGRLFLADATGRLVSIGATGEQTVFGGDAPVRVTAVDVSSNRITLGSREWVRIFQSDMLTLRAAPTYIRTLVAANPFTADLGFITVSESRLLAWRMDSSAVGLAFLDMSSAVFTGIESGFRAPLSGLTVTAEGAMGIEPGGTIRVTDLSTGASVFDMRIPGVSAVVRASATEIIAGRNASANAEGSLLRVNRTTEETVAISGRNVFTYALLMDQRSPRGPRLYSVGIDAAGATSLLCHEGAGFERETLIDTVAEEDLDVSMALDPDTHVLYATLGRDRIIAWDGSAVRTMRLEKAAPHGLVAGSQLLFCLNKDSTVTVVDAATGAWLAEMALFREGEWCMLFRDGRYAASTGGDTHVGVYIDEVAVEAKEDYRVRAEIR